MIDNYIRDTRLLGNLRPDNAMQAIYFMMISACESFCASPLDDANIDLRVAITYTAQRKCELIEVGATRTLIYDQSLGQILNTFNRILFFAKSSISVYRPIMRLLMDEAILLGRSDLAAFFLTKCMKYNSTWNLPRAASDPFVQTQTWLQECFIISHEYCHTLMAANLEFRAQRMRTGKIIWEPAEIGAPADIAKRLLERYGESWSLEDIRENISYIKDTINSSEHDLVEELGCDDFAFHAIAAYGHRTSLPPLDLFKATFLVLRHVRAINYVRAFMRQLADDQEPTGIDRRVALLQARQHQLRDMFPALLETIKLEDDTRLELRQLTASLLDDEISSLSDLHDKQIDEVILFELFPNLSEEFFDWKRRHKRTSRNDMEQCRQLALARDWVVGLKDFACAFPKEHPAVAKMSAARRNAFARDDLERDGDEVGPVVPPS